MIINETINKTKDNKQWLTRKEAFMFLHDNNFLHRGKTITLRTMRTLFERGIIKDFMYEGNGRLKISLKEISELAVKGNSDA